MCGARLQYRSGRQTPWERSITWCPSCQPEQARITADLARARKLLALHPAVREPPFISRLT